MDGPAPAGSRLPPGRYGPEPTAAARLRARLGVGLLAVVFLTWLFWAAWHQADRDVRWSDVGFDIVGPGATEVTFDVVKDPQATVTCRLRALNRSYAEVGVAEVEVRPAQGSVVRTTQLLRTTEEAVSAGVDRCSLAQ